MNKQVQLLIKQLLKPESSELSQIPHKLHHAHAMHVQQHVQAPSFEPTKSTRRL